MQSNSIYICPKTKKPLSEHDDGLLRDDGFYILSLEETIMLEYQTFLPAKSMVNQQNSPWLCTTKRLRQRFIEIS